MILPEYDVIISSSNKFSDRNSASWFMCNLQNIPIKLDSPYEVAILSLQVNGLRRSKTKPYLVQMENIENSFLNDCKRPYLTIVYGNKSTNYFSPVFKRYKSDNLHVLTIFLTDLDAITPVSQASEVIVRLLFKPCFSN